MILFKQKGGELYLSKFKNINEYFERMLTANSPKDIEKFFKNNKIKSNTVIDLNKYLIG